MGTSPISQCDGPFPGPCDIIAIGVGLCTLGIAALAGSQTISLLQRPWFDFDISVFEYRLTGFDEKVGTLAEHLAKLLGHNVAGYPPSGPNPERDPDRGWCNTVRRIIREIDRSRYSPKQLSRDLEAAGFGGMKCVDGVKEVIERGLCDDHWGDFSGGSLATG